MKINEVILTEDQLDELNLKGLGTGLGKAIGGAAGGVVQGAKNIWTGMKQGYTGAQQALAPDDAGSTAPAGGSAPAAAPTQATGGAAGGAAGGTTPAQTGGAGEVAGNDLLNRAKQGTAQDPKQSADATARGQQNKGFGFNNDTGVAFNSQEEKDAYMAQKAQGGSTPATADAPAQQPAASPAAAPAGGEAPAAPAADQQSKVGVGQINKIIPTLRTRDLNSVKKNVDATLAKKQKQPAAPAAAPAQGAAPAAAPAPEEDDNPNIQRGYNMQESKIVKFRSNFLGMDI
jgi:hypothetical protein